MVIDNKPYGLQIIIPSRNKHFSISVKSERMHAKYAKQNEQVNQNENNGGMVINNIYHLTFN